MNTVAVETLCTWLEEQRPLTILDMRPTQEYYERIIGFNEAGILPEEDPTELEAGANRCAIS